MKPKNKLILIGKGFLMGTCDVIPGVSGGTMALILGIYQELVERIKGLNLKFISHLVLSFLKKNKRHQLKKTREAISNMHLFDFLVPLFLGIIIAVFTGAKIIPRLIKTYPEYTWSFFFGLIVASTRVPYSKIRNKGIKELLAFFVALLLAFVLAGLPPQTSSPKLWFVFICGTVAISAMILPGISGAFVLLLLGQYQYALEAIEKGDLIYLITLASGCGIGLIGFVRVLSWFLSHYYNPTMAVLVGLMLGSLRRLWPFKQETKGILKNVIPQTLDTKVFITALCFFIGCFLVWYIYRLSEQKKEKEMEVIS